METYVDNLQPQSRLLYIIMTGSDIVSTINFTQVISSSYELYKFANLLMSDSDLFVNIIKDGVGSSRVQSMLGISDAVNRIVFYAIMVRFTEIMTQIHSYNLVLRILNVCNIHQIKILCHVTVRNTLVLANDVYGCSILKRVITIAEDHFKGYFLNLIAENALLLSEDDLGCSLIQHALKLDFTHKTTQGTRLHELMAEFDDILSRSNIEELHRIASKLASDSDLFTDFIKTMRGSLMVHIILGKSEEVDTIILEAIKKRFTDVLTDKFGYLIVLHIINIFKKRGPNFEVKHVIFQQLIALQSLSLTKDPTGSTLVQHLIDLHIENLTGIIACRLQRRFIELSFHTYGRNVVEKLVGDGKSVVALACICHEIVRCDEDTLVNLAKDDYGNKILKNTLEFARKRRLDLFVVLVEKFKPFVDRLRGSQGENIAAIIDSEEETVKDPIASESRKQLAILFS